MLMRVQDIMSGNLDSYIDSNGNPLMTASSTESLQQQAIRRQVSFEEDYHPTTSIIAPSAPVSSSTLQHRPGAPVLIPEECSSFWFSGSAKNLFCPLEGETAEEAVNNMINILERATANPNNCRSIVQGNRENLNLLHEEDLRKVYAKAVYLREALYIARATINDGKHLNFRECCNQVVRTVGGQVKPYTITAGNTIGGWFRDFRQGRAFSHYRTKVLKELGPLMAFFDMEPDLNKLFKLQLMSNLSALSSKNAYKLFFRNMVPVAAAKRGYGQADGPKKVIAEFGLDRVHYIHFRKWLNLQDFVDVHCPDSGTVVWTYRETVDL
jgi:hypothetical protein